MMPVQELGLLRTLTGPVPVSAIDGPILAHEHLQIDLRWPVRVASDPSRCLQDESRVCAELAALRDQHGLSLVVDLTGMGMGRSAAALSRISAASRVAVVAATGLLADPFHPEFVRDAGTSEIAARMLAEIWDGMDGTAIRPGVIGELGTWEGLPSRQEERCLRAAARAALESGLSVATHGPSGLAQLEILTGEGLPAERVAVGHQDLFDDPGVHRKIAELGAYVSFGMLGRSRRAGAMADGARLRRVLELVDAGQADRILLSNGVSRMAHLAAYGGSGYGHLFQALVPSLRAAGVDERTLSGILRDNPLRWLTGSAAGADRGAGLTVEPV